MDQGTAAVLGASVGVAGTLGTGFLAYLAARHQIRDQAKLDHRKTIRSERREAYRDFLRRVSEIERDIDLFMLKIVKLQLDGSPPSEWIDTFSVSTALSDDLKNLNAQSTDLLLAGPADLAILISPVITALNDEWEVVTRAGIEFRWNEEEEEAYESARAASGSAVATLGARASRILNAEI
ncbi:hypothetical protein [[Kitasatospora] papulosa]|uniref:hypothetical protein n=1 Tax=[Kitasatospora] papulosa TaxID=1464011 RepID=UPI00367A6781